MLTYQTDPQVFQRLREDWLQKLGEDTWDHFDLELIPVLKKFNQIPGLVTFMSCAGHPERERESASGKVLYITFGFQSEGIAALLQIYEVLQERYVQRFPKHDWRGPRNLKLTFSVRAHAPRPNQPPAWWKSVSIGLDIPMGADGECVKEFFLPQMLQVLDAYLDLQKPSDQETPQ